MKIDESITVLPAAWNALVNTLCQNAPYLQASLLHDVSRFSQQRLASGYLSAAFNTSLLAYNGCPIEFTTSTLKPLAVSCTLDPFLPLHNQARSIDAFCDHYLQISELADRDAVRAYFKQIDHIQSQSAQPLRFGSWLGRKYTPNDAKTKVYSEVQSSNAVFAELQKRGLSYSLAELKQAGLSLLMLGYYPEQSDSPTEYYYQWHSAEITFTDIAEVMRFFDCESLFPTLAPLIGLALQQTVKTDEFPHTTYGFSLVYNARQQLESFTLFTIASRFFGSNQRVSEGINALLAETEQSMPLLQNLLDEKIPLQFNVMGFSSDLKGNCGISCTFSPQNTCFKEMTITLPRHASSMISLSELLEQQAASGAFLSHVRTPDGRWYQDENAFVTAQVLRTLDYNSQTAPYIEKALDFLMTCETKPLRFGFWPTNAHPDWMKQQSISADIDDTAIITELLYKFDRISLDTVEQTLSHMNSYRVQRVDPRLSAIQHQWAECPVFHTWMKENNEISQLDCCVNTNALILLHKIATKKNTPMPAYSRIVKMLNNALSWSDNSYDKISILTPYYAHPNEWLVALKYARDSGIPQLNSIIKQLTKWQLPGYQREIPLYRRHDGQFLWTSSCLNQFRNIMLTDQTKDIYEYFPQ